MSISYRAEFQIIEPNVFLNAGNSLSPEEVKDITEQAKAHVTKRDYICLSNDYFNVDVVAHELTHAELHSYLSADAQRRIPAWFDEGLATQNDYREKYNYENWIKKTDNGKNVTLLDDMDTIPEFQCSNEEERQFHYICAKYEIKQWLDKHPVQDLIDFVKNVNGGEDFYRLYDL